MLLIVLTLLANIVQQNPYSLIAFAGKADYNLPDTVFGDSSDDAQDHVNSYCSFHFPDGPFLATAQDASTFPTVTVTAADESGDKLKSFNCVEIGRQLSSEAVPNSAYQACMCEIFRRGRDFKREEVYPELSDFKGCALPRNNFSLASNHPTCNVGRFQQAYCPFFGCCYDAGAIRDWETKQGEEGSYYKDWERDAVLKLRDGFVGYELDDLTCSDPDVCGPRKTLINCLADVVMGNKDHEVRMEDAFDARKCYEMYFINQLTCVANDIDAYARTHTYPSGGQGESPISMWIGNSTFTNVTNVSNGEMITIPASKNPSFCEADYGGCCALAFSTNSHLSKKPCKELFNPGSEALKELVGTIYWIIVGIIGSCCFLSMFMGRDLKETLRGDNPCYADVRPCTEDRCCYFKKKRPVIQLTAAQNKERIRKKKQKG